MKIVRVDVSYQVNVFYKKYRSIHLGYTLGAALDEGEDSGKVKDLLRQKIRNTLVRDAREEVLKWRELGAKVEAAPKLPDLE